MDINASVDIGNNIKQLIQQLAQSMGTTADKILPYYVKQAYISAIGSLIAFLFFISICFLMALYNLHYINKKDFDWDNDFGPPHIMTIVSMICGGIALIIFSIEFNTILASVYNPEYKGVHMLIEDIAKLAHK